MSPSDLPIRRREFLAAAAVAAAGAAVPGLFATHLRPPLRLIVRNARPLDAETPLEAMTSWRTPNHLFFVRSHFGPPPPSPDWTLTIDGEVSRPLSLYLDELRRLPAVTRPVTLECAGNGRGLYTLPGTSGVQWARGAVSNAEWTGVPLSVLLERTGLSPGAAHLWTEAADRAPMGNVPRFLRSIPRQVAMETAFLAWEMNGEPIPALHGGPLRLLVPGWFGMASTKWLTHLHARREPSDNHFMARGYRWPDGSAVEWMRVKSAIATPTEGAVLPAGALRVAGVAWTGRGTVRRVEVSGDGGGSWADARLTSAEHAGAWRTWEHTLRLPAGRAVIQARATDSTGAVQPVAAAPNPAGYGNNAIHEVRIDARG
jgi:sulfite oxidase